MLSSAPPPPPVSFQLSGACILTWAAYALCWVLAPRHPFKGQRFSPPKVRPSHRVDVGTFETALVWMAHARTYPASLCRYTLLRLLPGPCALSTLGMFEMLFEFLNIRMRIAVNGVI
jgi:hypothetical protein